MILKISDDKFDDSIIELKIHSGYDKNFIQ
jgi:hypothetical protein